MVKLLILVLTVIVLNLYVTNCYKILAIFPIPAKSHKILGDGVVRHLISAGHQVTYVTPYPSQQAGANYREVDLSSNINLIPKNRMNITDIMGKQNDHWLHKFLFFAGLRFAKESLKHENFQNLLADQSQEFDVVIAEWMFSELYAGIAKIYDAPLIWFVTIEPHWMILSVIDDYMNPSYNTYDLEGQPPLTFLQRLQELWFMIKQTVFREIVNLYLINDEHQRLIVPHIEARGKIAPTFQESRYNASLVLGNSHVSMGQALSLPQNYKPVGGFHINEEVAPLPEDIRKIIEESKHGVIYFSMGTNLNSKDMPTEMKTTLLKMFGTLQQTIIWKFEEKPTDKPENVNVLKWAPQQSILAHPKVLMFITHGGLLSITEAISAGKPVIGIPVFADQHTNIATAVKKGFGRKVTLSYSMADDLKIAIEEVLNDTRYSTKAKELSFIYHHRPMKPGKEIVHWVEHVIKTKGAPHLRSPALMVSWYQKIYLDLAAVLIIIGLFIRLIYFLIKKYMFKKAATSKKIKIN